MIYKRIWCFMFRQRY